MDEWQLKMDVTLEEYYQILAQRAEKQGISFEMENILPPEVISEESSEESSEDSETGKIEFIVLKVIFFKFLFVWIEDSTDSDQTVMLDTEEETAQEDIPFFVQEDLIILDESDEEK